MRFPIFRLLAAYAVLAQIGIATAADPAEEYRQAMVTAQEQFQEAASKATAKYVATLKESLTEETKKGNLDGAIAIREQIKSLEQQPTVANIVLDKLAGTDWVNSNGIPFQWKKDGSFLWNGKPGVSAPIDANRVAIVFANYRVAVLVFNEDCTTFEQWGQDSKDRPLFTGKKAPLKR